MFFVVFPHRIIVLKAFYKFNCFAEIHVYKPQNFSDNGIG
jgi:hypothetical protein